MSPSAPAERLPTDPAPDSPEHAELVRDYRAQVAKLARLRQLEADLPLAIHDAEVRARDMALRLGLPSATATTPAPRPGLTLHRPAPPAPDPRPAPSPRAGARRPAGLPGMVLAALEQCGPSTATELRQATGAGVVPMRNALQALRTAGWAEHDGRRDPCRWRSCTGTSPAATPEPPELEPDP